MDVQHRLDPFEEAAQKMARHFRSMLHDWMRNQLPSIFDSDPIPSDLKTIIVDIDSPKLLADSNFLDSHHQPFDSCQFSEVIVKTKQSITDLAQQEMQPSPTRETSDFLIATPTQQSLTPPVLLHDLSGDSSFQSPAVLSMTTQSIAKSIDKDGPSAPMQSIPAIVDATQEITEADQCDYLLPIGLEDTDPTHWALQLGQSSFVMFTGHNKAEEILYDEGRRRSSRPTCLLPSRTPSPNRTAREADYITPDSEFQWNRSSYGLDFFSRRQLDPGRAYNEGNSDIITVLFQRKLVVRFRGTKFRDAQGLYQAICVDECIDDFEALSALIFYQTKENPGTFLCGLKNNTHNRVQTLISYVHTEAMYYVRDVKSGISFDRGKAIRVESNCVRTRWVYWINVPGATQEYKQAQVWKPIPREIGPEFKQFNYGDMQPNKFIIQPGSIKHYLARSFNNQNPNSPFQNAGNLTKRELDSRRSNEEEVSNKCKICQMEVYLEIGTQAIQWYDLYLSEFLPHPIDSIANEKSDSTVSHVTSTTEGLKPTGSKTKASLAISVPCSVGASNLRQSSNSPLHKTSMSRNFTAPSSELPPVASVDIAHSNKFNVSSLVNDTISDTSKISKEDGAKFKLPTHVVTSAELMATSSAEISRVITDWYPLFLSIFWKKFFLFTNQQPKLWFGFPSRNSWPT